MDAQALWRTHGFGLRESAAADYRKDGKDIVFRRADRKFGMPRIDHQHTHFFPVDSQGIDNIANRYLFAYLAFLDFESIIAKIGEQFDRDFFICHLKIPKSIDLLAAEVEDDIVRRQLLGVEEFRQPVIDRGETGGGVEGFLGFKNVLAEAHHVVTGQ